jgi:TonB family protein
MLVLGGLAASFAGCAGASGSASRLAAPPAYDPAGQTKCRIASSRSRPLVVEWPSADRADLEARAKRGLLVVRYTGCDIEVLPACMATYGYTYTPVTAKAEGVAMRTVDDLYANVPIGAARLEGKLEQAGELDAEMTIVGLFEASRSAPARADLEGDCAGATHVVHALTVGAFVFYAGGSATLGAAASAAGIGAGAKSAARREVLSRDGDPTSCERSGTANEPPPGCGAVLRIELRPVDDAPPGARRDAPAFGESCDEHCTGTGTPALASALQVLGAKAGICYSRARSANASLEGNISIRVRVSPSGSVCSAVVASNDMGTPAVSDCAAEIFRTAAALPAPNGGCVSANVPMHFGPR